MPRITSEQAGGGNVCAFLDMIAFSEGTDNGRQPTKDDGYDVLVGGELFPSYAKHPNIYVVLPKLKLKSSAAGRYQMLNRTWEEVARRLKLTDFSPLSQDKACIELIRRRGALDDVKAGLLHTAIAKCRKEWASLPGADYGQHEQKLSTLRDAYLKAGGKFTRAVA